MRKDSAQRSDKAFKANQGAGQHESNATAHASVGLGALPVLGSGVGKRRVDHKGDSPLVGIVRMLLEAGEVADVDKGEPLAEIAQRGLRGWLEKSWGGMKHFELRFTLCSNILQAVDDSQPEDPYAAGRLAEAVMEDFGIDLAEPMVAFGVGTTGQRWTRVGPKVTALEALHKGLGWEALRAVSAIGTRYGMMDMNFLESAASQTYWAGGDSEKDWVDSYGEDLSDFGGMTRAEFDEALPLKEMNASKSMALTTLRQIAKKGEWFGEVARRLLALRKLKNTRPAFQMPNCDEQCDYYQLMDIGVVMEWMETAPVQRIVDDHMNPYMQSGEGIKDRLGAIALRLDGGKDMIALTRQWRAASTQLRHADALLDLLAEENDAIQ
jgi:hypothetical protein